MGPAFADGWYYRGTGVRRQRRCGSGADRSQCCRPARVTQPGVSASDAGRDPAHAIHPARLPLPRLEALRKARQTVLRKRVQSLPGRVLDWAGSEPWRKSADPKELIGSFGARALKRSHEDLSRSADGIDWTDGERRHRVRIRVKRLRYGLDCFAGGFAPAAVDRFGHRLHALQEVLGKLNDFRVQRSLLRQLEILRPSLPASRTESLLASRERSLTGQAAVAWSKVGARPRRWRREAARARG